MKEALKYWKLVFALCFAMLSGIEMTYATVSVFNQSISVEHEQVVKNSSDHHEIPLHQEVPENEDLDDDEQEEVFTFAFEDAGANIPYFSAGKHATEIVENHSLKEDVPLYILFHCFKTHLL